jgi:hypothetical protein
VAIMTAEQSPAPGAASSAGRGSFARFVLRHRRLGHAVLVGRLPGRGRGGESRQQQAAAPRAALPGWQGGVTGINHLASGGSSSGPGVFTETMIGAGGALVILVVVFASLLALVPLVIAAVSILTTLLLVLALTTFTEVSFIVQFLVALVGLGVGIDYSLLLVPAGARNATGAPQLRRRGAGGRDRRPHGRRVRHVARVLRVAPS